MRAGSVAAWMAMAANGSDVPLAPRIMGSDGIA
jgi:hypothetical protein